MTSSMIRSSRLEGTDHRKIVGQQSKWKKERRRGQEQHVVESDDVHTDDDYVTPAADAAPDVYDKLWLEHASSVERINNVDVVTSQDGSGKNRILQLCHLAAFVPITFVDDGRRIPYGRGRDIKGMAGVILALRHLNNGDGSVVQQLEGLNQSCSVRFTTEIFDTERSQYATVNKLLDVLQRKPGSNERLPCAFLGASRSAITMPMSIITGLSGYPQVSHYSTSSTLDDRNQYKMFGRVIPSDDGLAFPAISYLRKRLHVRHLGVIHGNDSYGIAFSRSLKRAAAKLAPDMVITPVEIEYRAPTRQEISEAVWILSNTRFRYFMAIVNVGVVYQDLMEEAFTQGIAGDGYTWIFSDSLNVDFITRQEFEKDSPLERATRGISVLQAIGGQPGMPGYDKFARAYRGLNNKVDVRYIESKIPRYEDDPEYVSPAVADLLDHPNNAAAFLYDATVALGLSACALGNNGTSSNGKVFDGREHYEALKKSNFVGASGNIVLDNTTGSRDPNSAVFSLTYFVPDSADNSNKGNDRPGMNVVKFSAVQSDLFKGGKWQSIAPYVFSDGSTSPPGDLPDLTLDPRYIGTGLRAAGLSLSAIVILLSAGFSLWTYRKRTGKVVKASQPVFLHFICFGTLLMGSSIIPLSIDDENTSLHGCDVACIATPWLLVIGYALAIGALFSKTWRLNRIFYNPEMRRIRVTTCDVVLPMVATVLINVVILSVWTAVSPRGWERAVTGVDAFGRTVESQGYCTSDPSLPYLIALAVTNGCALIKALHQVYRARKISNAFGETQYIALAMLGVLLVVAVGIPVMIIAEENARANYFVSSVIIFVLCTLLILFIFVPKVRFHRQVVKGKTSMRNILSEFSRQSTMATRESSERQKLSMPSILGRACSDDKIAVETERKNPKSAIRSTLKYSVPRPLLIPECSNCDDICEDSANETKPATLFEVHTVDGAENLT